MAQDTSAEKLPPQAIEAEQSVLGGLMIDKNAIIKVVDFLRPRDFYKGTHQEIYKTMVELFEKNEPIDILAVASRLKEKNLLEEIGGRGYLTDLINRVPTASHISNYAKMVQKKRILRDLIDAGQEIEASAYNEAEDVDIVLDQAEKKIFSIAQKGLTQVFLPVKSTLEEAFERIDMLSKHQGGMRGLATGFKDLDNMLAGLQKSDLVILAARPSMGKSALGMNIAANIALNLKIPVGIFSLEMSKDQVVDRLIATLSNTDLWRLRTGRLSSEGEENDFTRIQKAMAILSEAPLYIDDAASSNILQMRAMARRLQAEKGLGLLVVDYLQLMEPRNPTDSIVQQVTEVSRSLKSLARELEIPVLAISQLSRAVEQRSPQIPRLADLRESGCLVGETLIIESETGKMIPIKELAERKEQTPIKILALDENYKIGKQVMTKVFYSGKKMVFELKTRSGRKIKASANHPFLKLEGWSRLDGLKVNDRIALPRKIETKNPANPLSPNEIILLAHLLGDGCILPRQPFHYTSADEENIQTVKRAAKELFNIEGKLVKQKNWYHLYLPSPHRLTHGIHHPVTNWFKKLGINLVHSWEKQIPEAIFQGDEEKISLFLKHLWSTDGNLSWKRLKGRIPTGNIYYATSSEKMAEQVQHLLLQLGVQSSLRENQKKNYRKMYQVYVEGAENQLRFLSLVGIAGKRKEIVPLLIKELEKIIPNPNNDIIPKEAWQIIIEPAKEEAQMSWREFSQGIDTAYCGTTLFKAGLSRQRMMRVYKVLEDENILKLATSDIYWDKIVSIEKLGTQDVYDATVEGVHNFVANDIVVHNSLEQDADVVLFIYKEDRYRPDTSRKGIADLIVAKHRNGPVGKVELYFDERMVTFRDLEKSYEGYET